MRNRRFRIAIIHISDNLNCLNICAKYQMNIVLIKIMPEIQMHTIDRKKNKIKSLDKITRKERNEKKKLSQK